MKAVRKVCDEYGLMLVLDASLLQDNMYFIKTREESCKNKTIREIADLSDVIYFSARKLGAARGGGIITKSEKPYRDMRHLVPLFEGFLTYGGMSVREMEAMTVGLEETMDEEVINQGPQFIAYMVNELDRKGIPVVTPAGGLGCHLDASRFIPQVPQVQYPAGALAAAMYIAGGVRGMERGTLSEQRNPDGSERLAEVELLRLAMPRRVFTLSQVKYAIDRITWLHENRALISGLKFIEEPPVLRFFMGRLEPVSDWQTNLAAKFRADLGDSL
jgi:tryptophanase